MPRPDLVPVILPNILPNKNVESSPVITHKTFLQWFGNG